MAQVHYSACDHTLALECVLGLMRPQLPLSVKLDSLNTIPKTHVIRDKFVFIKMQTF